MSQTRDLLAGIPAFPADLPVLDVDSLPANPDVLFTSWLLDATRTEARQAHAMTFVTTRGDGVPVGRTLILKDFGAGGYQFSTHRSSRKGQQLEANPGASMVFLWKETGRQVRITGMVRPLGEEASQADWQARPSYDGSPNPDWQLYVLEPREFEFMQAREDRKHTRIEYQRSAEGTWEHQPVSSPAG